MMYHALHKVFVVADGLFLVEQCILFMQYAQHAAVLGIRGL